MDAAGFEPATGLSPTRLKAAYLRPLGHASVVSRAGFEPAVWRLKRPLPSTVLGDRLAGPQPIRTATSTFQASGAARLHQGPEGAFRGIGRSARPPRTPPLWRRPHHCPPRSAAFRFFRSQCTRRRIPKLRFFRNQITSYGIRRPSRREQSEQSESNAHLEVYGLGCCPYTMPRQSSGRRTREPSLSIRWEAHRGPCRFVLRGDSGHGRQNR